VKLHQIRYFLALCDERNFTHAANKCGVSQPSLTNGIKALEDELGGMLFTRRPNVVLTPLGFAVRRRLMRVAKDIGEVLEIARSLHRRPVASADGASQMSRPLL
jgi:DNA-binding transcriptional LysR family regulator